MYLWYVKFWNIRQLTNKKSSSFHPEATITEENIQKT